MSNGKKWTSEEDERLLELKAKGLKLRMIAKRLNRTGASADSRLRALRRNGKRAVSDGRDRAEGEISASRPATWCWTPPARHFRCESALSPETLKVGV